MITDDDVFDERGLLKDGHRLRVRMFARDSVQAAIAGDRQSDAGRLALHRPGFRACDGVDGSATEQAYQQMVADQAAAWQRGPGSVASSDAIPSVEQPSTPAWRPGVSLADAEAIKAAAYNEYVKDSQEAWKRLGAGA
jgi:hypothetical protein